MYLMYIICLSKAIVPIKIFCLESLLMHYGSFKANSKIIYSKFYDEWLVMSVTSIVFIMRTKYL